MVLNMFTEHVQSRAEQRDATQRKVLVAAEKLFRKQGFESTTVRQIAADAGVSSGTVMSVGDKDGLLVAVFDDRIAAVHANRKGLARKPSHANAPRAIAKLFDPFLAYFAEDPALSRRYASIIVRGGHTSSIFGDLAEILVGEIESALLQVGLGEPGAARSARTIYFAYLGIVLSGSNQALENRSVPDQLRDVIECVLAPTRQGE
ncbi:TetR/AcrR family transcriptional regulator [Mycobacterium sp. E802]|uniref:TetR/AcrR family transcriptional regulator n=1 Tax=Mycobacterium sp. E802 TaxID=1834152 RepID=UPI000B230DD4|nr:TetR/AcrR family transcriptional regulator [Mycobacterium sp. E802]